MFNTNSLVSDERQTAFSPKEKLLQRNFARGNNINHDTKGFTSESVLDAVRFLIHANVSPREFETAQWICEDHCQHEMNRARKQEVKRSFVRLLGARDPSLQKPTKDDDDEFTNIVNAAAAVKNKTSLVIENDKFIQTEEQEREERIIANFKAAELPRLLLAALAQLYLLFAVPIRFSFDWRRPVHVIVLEALLLDLPLLVNLILTVFVAPVTHFGLERFPPMRDRFKELFILEPFAWLTLLGVVPLEIIGAVFAGRSEIQSDYYAGLYKNFDSAESPVWHANRIIHGLLFIPSLVVICDMILFRFGWNPEITRLLKTFAQLLTASHMFACVAIKWRPKEPAWLMKSFNVTSMGGGDWENVTYASLSRAQAFQVYITKHDWMLKQMVTFDAGPPTFPDAFRFWLTVAIVIVGLTISAMVIAVISSIVERETSHTEVGKVIDLVMDAGAHMRLPPSLTRQIIEDVSHRAVAGAHMMQPADVFRDVPAGLLRRLLEVQGAQVVRHVPLFAPCLAAPLLLVEIAKNLTPMVLPPLQVLFRRGDAGNALYFVVDGWLAVLKEEGEESLLVYKKKKNKNEQKNNDDNNTGNLSSAAEGNNNESVLDVSTFGNDVEDSAFYGNASASFDNHHHHKKHDVVSANEQEMEVKQQRKKSSSDSSSSDSDNDGSGGWKQQQQQEEVEGKNNRSQRDHDSSEPSCVRSMIDSFCCTAAREESARKARLQEKLIAFDESLERYTLGPGHVIGEISVIAHSPRTATVRARRGQFVHLLVLSRDVLDVQQTRFHHIFASIRYAAKVRYLDMIKQQQQQQQQSPTIKNPVQYVRSGPRSREK